MNCLCDPEFMPFSFRRLRADLRMRVLCLEPQSGFRHVAQGCTPQAGYPGLDYATALPTPTGLRQTSHDN